MPYINLHSRDSKDSKRITKKVSKPKGDVISVSYLQEILPAILSNKTTVFSCSIFVLKTILCKTLLLTGAYLEFC